MVRVEAKLFAAILVLSSVAYQATHAALRDQLRKYLTRDVREDALLSSAGLIMKNGYPVETHKTVTEDGYILTTFRIPYGRNSSSNKTNSRPVLVQHGLLSSSDDWVAEGPHKSMGFVLADAGYDVWLGNSRGNRHSRQHVKLKPWQSKFWDFSWHEMGKYDLPSLIDYILTTTGLPKLHYVGHSMGTTAFLVLASEHPEYTAKMRMAVLLAPAAYIKHSRVPFIHIIARIAVAIAPLAKVIRLNELLPYTDVNPIIAQKLCRDGAVTQPLCAGLFYYLAGYDPDQLNKTSLPVAYAHFPAGEATKVFLHYAQSVVEGKFRPYDYGPLENFVKYGSKHPPAYDFRKNTAPVSLHYGERDSLAVPKDVARLDAEIPNLIGRFRVPYDKFNHFDFVFAIDVKKLLYDFLIRLMGRY